MRGGMKHGKGSHCTANLTYIGMFENDMRQGEGSLTSEKDEYNYDGQWH